MLKVNLQKLFCVTLSLILTFGTLFVVPNVKDVQAASFSASYDILQNNYPEFLQKLRDGGANDSQIKAFFDDLDADVQQQGNLAEDNIDSVVYQSLMIVLTRTEHGKVFKALWRSFDEEIQYTLETHTLHPNMLPLHDAIVDSVLGVPVTGVSLNQNTIIMSVGSNPNTLVATVSPTNANDKSITWASDKPDVATVDESGKVIAVSAGVAVITVTTQNGGKTSKCTVNVTTEETKSSDASLSSLKPDTGNTITGSVGIVQESGVATNTSANAIGSDKQLEKNPIAIGQLVSLSDIGNHWAEANIKRLVASEVINGYPDGSFKPNNTITRAEFATVLIKEFKMPLQSGKIFDDTSNHWAVDYIATAAAYGIVNGYSDTEYGANDFITREQMAAMIVKAINLQKLTVGKTFADSDQVSGWARDAVATASAKNIISGYPDNTFNPKGNATRAEAVTVIVNALK